MQRPEDEHADGSISPSVPKPEWPIAVAELERNADGFLTSAALQWFAKHLPDGEPS